MEDEKLFQLAKLYLEDILLLGGIPRKQSKLLFTLWKMSKSSAMLVLNPYVKEKVAKQSGITVGTLNNKLTKMKESNLLFKTSNGNYELSPILDNIITLSEEEKVVLTVVYQNGEKEIIMDKQK